VRRKVFADCASIGGGLHGSGRHEQVAYALIETVWTQTWQHDSYRQGDECEADNFVGSIVHVHVLLDVDFMDTPGVKLCASSHP
jgi:hypothetical protein